MRQYLDLLQRIMDEGVVKHDRTGVGTKSQQALQMQLEQNKQERRAKSREQKLAEAERLFALKQQKKREKHKGH